MPNDYFQFQQFRIEQGACAMKVSTDACLLGAATDLAGATRLLDVGTGTGLLALMLAQRHPTVLIEAVEMNEAAAAQAAANVAASPWASRLQVHAQSLADYAASQPAPGANADLRFSHIVCNPPFFRGSRCGHRMQRGPRRGTRAAGHSRLASWPALRQHFSRRPGGSPCCCRRPRCSSLRGRSGAARAAVAHAAGAAAPGGRAHHAAHQQLRARRGHSCGG